MMAGSGLGRGGLPKLKRLVLSFVGLDALEEIEGGPRLGAAEPNESLVLVTASSFVVGDGDGGITPSKHWSKAWRPGRSCGWGFQQSSSIPHRPSVNHAACSP